MALISLGESKWRMLRRALRKRKFTWEDVRNMTRRDRFEFDWLVDNGFFRSAGGGKYEVTEKGKESADLGFYEV